ncbi:MAG TPA: DUF5698 domain-containing protein [Clostridia bacterium]|nr:DUF5698 domain-containing protein [Clostridia bacterium]
MLEYLASDHIGVYFIIFFGKIVENSMQTLRLVLLSRGQRTIGALVGFVEILLWVSITGSVLAGLSSAPLKAVVFAFAFAIGNYLGSYLEDLIALGLSTIQIIVKPEESPELVKVLRDNKLAVTITHGEGRDGAREILQIHLKRRRIRPTLALINKNVSNAVITVSDVRVVKGGYMRNQP